MARRRRLASRVRRALRALLAFLFSNVGVIVLVVAYTAAGAFMFQAIEGESEMERVHNMTIERDRTAQCLWQNALTFNMFNETALKASIEAALARHQRAVVRARRAGWDGRAPRRWSFSSAFLYSLTVISTIGYGHLSPKTNWGKVTTILYALLGMPLFLLYLSNVGELLASWFKCVYALACRRRACPGFSRRRRTLQIEISEAESIERPSHWHSPSKRMDHIVNYGRGVHRRDDSISSGRYSEGTSDFTVVSFDAQTITVPISVCVSVMVGYLIFGSMLFGMWENWDQLDGAYFCFISLSSIGFGDLVPGARVGRAAGPFLACAGYLTLGMALVAMCFTLMQEQVIHYFAGMKRALQRICRCKR